MNNLLLTHVVFLFLMLHVLHGTVFMNSSVRCFFNKPFFLKKVYITEKYLNNKYVIVNYLACGKDLF